MSEKELAQILHALTSIYGASGIELFKKLIKYITL